MNLAKPYQNITYKVGATNSQLQRAIEAALPAATAQMKEYAKNFKGISEKDTCQKIFNFLMQNIRYKVDGDNQKIKLPSAFLREKEGDCKSYSLFTASILANLKIPFSFTYASYNPKDHTPEHIYVTTKNGCIIDAVWGKFNSEKKACYKFQKPMNISYISGVKRHHSEKYEKREEHYHKKYLGTVAQPHKYRGLGRTGIDWGNAVGRSFSAGEVAEYFSKNATLAPARLLLEMFIRNNGGGIASFLYSMAFRTSPYDLPNAAKYRSELNAGLKEIASKYNVSLTFPFTTDELNKLNSKYTPSSSGATIDPNALKNVQTTTAQSIQSVLTPARYQQYMSWRKTLDAKLTEDNNLIAALNKKYPLSSRELPAATEASKAKYRGIEWKWFWSLGGSPDDLNVAVKEGATKSPRGLDANYVLNKAYNGGLSAKDIPLVIRGFVSAEFGDKFGLGQEGTYILAINGMKKRKGIGDAASTAAAIAAYSAAILPILSFIMSEIRKSTADQNSDNQGSSDNQNNQNNNQGNQGGDFLTSNNTMIIVGAAAVGAYLFLSK